ncbi:response regulator [Sphingopyxis sp. MSC1_008]|jgi:CheY-like chemotaxis protein|uniref:response regulator n=1 Tax=Sphingopyxis sp. MSC1_008 TaxID=2909265 RepID=UPI0020C16BD8|nr:response regulator [Sphingopyxis sp. MSC1_008]
MNRHILVVEDDPLVALMLEGYLDALGHTTVAVVESVAAALAQIASRDLDAAIVDVHLASGETSGPVADALRAADIPFLVTTGSLTAIDDPALAAAPLVAKPFALASLATALAELWRAPVED